MAGFKIVKKDGTKKPLGVRIRKEPRDRPETDTREVRFKGDLCDWPIQFPDDCRTIQREMAVMGYDMPMKDCQALGHALSVDHYPFKNVPEVAWLGLGHLVPLVRKHGKYYVG